MSVSEDDAFQQSYAFMAQKKEVVDEAFAGDIIGLPDTGNFKIGDTLTSGEELHSKDCRVSLLKCSNISRMPIL